MRTFSNGYEDKRATKPESTPCCNLRRYKYSRPMGAERAPSLPDASQTTPPPRWHTLPDPPDRTCTWRAPSTTQRRAAPGFSGCDSRSARTGDVGISECRAAEARIWSGPYHCVQIVVCGESSSTSMTSYSQRRRRLAVQQPDPDTVRLGLEALVRGRHAAYQRLRALRGAEPHARDVPGVVRGPRPNEGWPDGPRGHFRWDSVPCQPRLYTARFDKFLGLDEVVGHELVYRELLIGDRGGGEKASGRL